MSIITFKFNATRFLNIFKNSRLKIYNLLCNNFIYTRENNCILRKAYCLIIVRESYFSSVSTTNDFYNIR